MASKEEIKAKLDDPNVTPETKKQLLFDYAAAGGSKDELAQYERQLGLEPGTALAGGWAYSLFHDEDADVQQAQREHDLGQSWTNLNDSTPSPNSDAILDDGIVGLRIFDEFYPRFTKAGGDPGGVRPGGDVGTAALDPDSLRASVDELRGIDFTAFAADAASVDAVAKGVDDSRNHLAQAWANNLAGWTGGAAQAANGYKARFDGAVATLDEGIKPIPGAITTASSTIQTQVTDYAKLLHNQWGDGRMAQMTPEQVDAALEGKEKLPGVISELEKKIDELNNRGVFDRVMDFFGDLLAGAVGFLIAGPIGAIVAITGVEFAKEINEDNIEEETQKCRQALSGCEQKLQQFVSDYSTKASSVHEQTQAACQAVQESYDALFQATTGQGKLSADPFAALGATPDFENADHQGGGKGNGTGGGNGTSSTGGGGGGGAGSGGGGGGSGVPVNTGGGATSGTDPALAGPGRTDPSGGGAGLGTPGEPGTDPTRGGTGLPGIPIGGGGLGTGGTGSGSGLGTPGGPGTPGAPKEVTIKDGNKSITVGQPDARGRSKLTVDDGTGHPKTYDLDFDPANDGLGEDGGQLDGELVQAGPDGKAVIHDGESTITAERIPGEPDKLKLTVDDGTPPPDTYTVDFDSGSTGTPPSGTPASHLETPSSSASGFGGSAHTGGGGGGGGGGSAPIGGGGGGSHEPQPLDSGAATGAQTPGSSDQRAAATVGGPAHGPGGQGGPMGGMPMGGMGAGGQGGGDQTRGGSKWRTQGQLFDDDDPAATFNGIVGEDPGNRVSRPPNPKRG